MFLLHISGKRIDYGFYSHANEISISMIVVTFGVLKVTD